MIRRKHLVSIAILFMLLIADSQSALAASSSNLSWGSSGQNVVQVQQALNSRGYWCGTADGIYGTQTYNAVVRFQKATGLQVDGIVGPATKSALGIITASPSVSRGGARTLTMISTGYDDSYESNYPWYGAPSYIGLPLARGIVATDPKVIPMGTRLYIEGYGPGIAADQGGAIKGNRIDLFFDSRQEALNWGIRTVKVTIL